MVLIILLIAAISVPNMMRARMKANEGSAVASLRTINTAEAMYTSAYPEVGYSGILADLGSHGSSCESMTRTNSCLIMDPMLTSSLKSGYTFDLAGDGKVPDRNYTITAAPVSMGSSGRCIFVTDQSGQLHVADPNTGRFSESGASNTICGIS